MGSTAQKQEKLEQAKVLLTALGLPKAQCNNRSGWVFLALENMKPDDEWGSATTPLLLTVTIMEFIRNEYSMDYKPTDVVAYDEEREWLFLIEAVTSHGPVSPKRWIELEAAFKNCKVGLVYVTAFPNRAEFRKNAADVAWETEVWIADNPDYMIHFNGDRFLGPHTNQV